ncbi:MAG: hypothetical protein ACRDF0_03065, partial [Candidatus Limnocylindria bacterium]
MPAGGSLRGSRPLSIAVLERQRPARPRASRRRGWLSAGAVTIAVAFAASQFPPIGGVVAASQASIRQMLGTFGAAAANAPAPRPSAVDTVFVQPAPRRPGENG